MMKYDEFLELMKYRRTIRRFKPDPIPDEYITKILDAAHYSPSGANSQPWEFIVIKEPEVKRKVFEAYLAEWEDIWFEEMQRVSEYRHPAFNVSLEEKNKAKEMIGGWGDAPVYLGVIEDPRKQWGTVLIAFRDTHGKEILSTSMGHVGMTIYLAAASLGLGSQRVDTVVQGPYREILKFPEPLRLETIVPIGYRAYEPGPPHRLPLKEMVHVDHYDLRKFMRGEDFLKYLGKIRALGRPGYRVAVGEAKG